MENFLYFVGGFAICALIVYGIIKLMMNDYGH
jgi:hypothetical protein